MSYSEISVNHWLRQSDKARIWKVYQVVELPPGRRRIGQSSSRCVQEQRAADYRGVW
jgi:hypothetical protein